MTEFSLIRYRPELHDVWDRVVRQSHNGNFLHQRDYMDYHAHRFDEQSFIVEKKGKPVAVFPCNKVEDRIISHGGLTYAGLIHGAEVRATDALAIFKEIADNCLKIGGRTLEYKAIPHIFHRYPAEEDLYALYRMGATLVRRDLSSAVQMDCRLKLSDSRKNTIRKAIRGGLEVREGNFYDAYHALLAQSLSKFGATPVHTADELQLLASRFPERIRLFGAFLHGDILAGALVYDFGNVAHTQYLASTNEGKQTGALDCVLAHLLDEIYKDRKYFSFGISTEQGGHYLNPGLCFQKEGFGGRGIVHDFYELGLA